ncbi:MAG: primosomal protein N' [[Eubacterium] sulci]|nr:primosomal protein N' [[Eubacterium] sulci]
MKYAKLVIENRSRHTDRLYTYRCADDIKIGQVVKVPFSKGDTKRRGFVFEIMDDCDLDESKLKEISETEDDISLSEEMIETAIWMRQRYGIKYLDAVNCFIPRGKAAKKGKEKNPLSDTEGERQDIDNLTEEQKAACEEINAAIDTNRQENFLLKGVTGSGKTEVYMQAAARAISKGKTVIMLLPEIALTKQITERFIGRFGKGSCAILHSHLTGRERFDEWSRIRSGEAKIVIGARMAVFAPLDNIGLIILDEEHESTYKSDMTPKYETVDIAFKRLMHHKGVLLLGSATASIVSYQRAKEGIYKLIEMNTRYNAVELPDMSIVDMRQELRKGNRSIFSDKLYQSMDEHLQNGEQVILFLNRRGYSSSISCKDCGNTLMCPDCGISLTYHKKENAAVCHYCGRHFDIPKECPECSSKFIKFIGVGTEQVEEFVKKEFKDYETERFDLDTAKNSREVSAILNRFASGKTKILVGTQLVAKGLDFRNVGLACVVSADTTLNIPDYRSAERTFQLITQVAGRAGRGLKKGEVIIQTYNPESLAITAASKYDYEGFFAEEVVFRKLMKYPPFSDLIQVQFIGENESEAEKLALECKDYLSKKEIDKNENEIFGPKGSHQISKEKDVFRYSILIKASKGSRNKYIYYISKYGEFVTSKTKLSFVIDVNPYSGF